jgi:hypothetical protein
MKQDHFANPMRVKQSPLQAGFHGVAIMVELHLLTYAMHLDRSR